MMRFIGLLCWLVILTIVFGATISVRAEIHLAKNGKTDYVLVTAAKLNSYDELAVKELRDFLKRVTGADFIVVPEGKDSGRKGIYVGQTEFAAKSGVDCSKLGREEWQIKTVGDSLVITGGHPVGTLYGAYAFLEKIGVYFLTPDATAVPHIPELEIGLLDERRKPDFVGRSLHYSFFSSRDKYKWPQEELERFKLFCLRVRQNGGEWKFPMLYTGQMFKMTTQYSRFHNFYKLVDPEKYFATHPEYFSMTPEGVRYAGRFVKGVGILGGQLCLSNRAVWDITLARLKEYIRNDREKLPKEDWPILYDISAMDASNFICCCPECKKITAEEDSEAGLVLRYINFIAKEIAKEYPNMLIRTFAYTSAELAPKITKPAENVVIQYCDLYTRSDCFRPIDHPFNAVQLKKIQNWHRLGARLTVWDYWNMGGKFYWPPRMETNVDVLAPDLRIFRANGVESYFAQAEVTFSYPQTFLDLQHFVGYYLLVNVNRDPEELIDIFVRNYYGAAAPEVKSWLDRIRAGIKKDSQKQMVMIMKNWQYNTPQFAVDSYKLLKQAEVKVASDPARKKRVDELRLALIWNILYFWHSNAPAMKAAGVSRDKLLKECRDLSAVYLDKYHPGKPEVLREEFESKYVVVAETLPIPEKFKSYPEDSIRIFGHPHYYKKPYSAKVTDRGSITGFAVKSPLMGKDPDSPKKFVSFSCENLDTRQIVRLIVSRNKIPRDEQFHWYKMPAPLTIGNTTLFASNGGWLIIDISGAFINADGAAEVNRWDVWFSAKLTGPAYVDGSKAESAIAVDQVVLVRPEGWKNPVSGK